MAISGAGGWIPSVAVKVRDGQLITVGITQNKPHGHVCTDMEFAALWIQYKLKTNGDSTIQIDFRGCNFADLQSRLHRMRLLKPERSQGKDRTFQFKLWKAALTIRLTITCKFQA